MILQNNTQTIITINASSYKGKSKAIINSGAINIIPNQSKDIPKELCDNDFVRNLIKIGELQVIEKKSTNTTSAKNTNNKKPKNTPKEDEVLREAREDAEIEGVPYKEEWTADQIRKEILKATNGA